MKKPMGKLFLLCGEVGSGKSTYALKLKEQHGGMILSADHFMIHFFGRDLPCAEHQARLAQCKV